MERMACVAARCVRSPRDCALSDVPALELEARAALMSAICAAAETLLDLRDHSRCLSPRAPRLMIGRLGPKPRDVTDHVVLDAIARGGANATVPLRAGTWVVRTLAERVARPRRRRG